MEKRNSGREKAQKAKRPWSSGPGPVPIALCALILLLSLTAFYHLFLHLISQIHYHRAEVHLRDGNYGLAISHLKTAYRYGADDYRIPKQLGDAFHQLGQSAAGARQAFLFALKAKAFYHEASSLNPIDADTAYGQAREEVRLEKLFEYLHPEGDHDPYEALPFFRRAILLRPNAILYRYAMARYLYDHKRTDELLTVVRTLARVYPPAYHYLKGEPLWAPPVREAVKDGIGQAIEKGILQREAHRSMSFLLAEEGEWPGAIAHYGKALLSQPFHNNVGDYIHLGRLYLKDGDPEGAQEAFFQALELSRSKEGDLEGLYQIYKDEDYSEEFHRFYGQASRRFSLSYQADILLARNLIDLKRYDRARGVLVELIEKEPTAEAYYLLARIAHLQEDWDSMELAIQKATVLEPANSQYHLLFSEVLTRMRKLDRAEKEATLAIKHSPQPSPWLFNNRAWIRWAQEDYSGAAGDWKSAIRLSSETASFYAQAAEAYRMLGDWPVAIHYYQKALELDPENKGYRKRYRELKAESKAHEV
jgi:tetratricopeptide (TPR) repeat protein